MNNSIELKFLAGEVGWEMAGAVNGKYTFEDSTVIVGTTFTKTLATAQTVVFSCDDITANIRCKATKGQSLFVGNLSDFSKLTYYLNLSKCTKVEGNLSSVSGLTYLLDLYNCVKIEGNLSSLSGLTYHLSLSNCPKIEGNLSSVSGLIYLLALFNCTNVEGNLSSISGLTYYLNLTNCSKIEGNLSSVSGLTYLLNLANCSKIEGNLSSVSGLTYLLDLYNCVKIEGVFNPTSCVRYTFLQNTGMSPKDVDLTAINLAKFSDTSKRFEISGLTRSTKSNDAIAKLISQNWFIADASRILDKPEMFYPRLETVANLALPLNQQVDIKGNLLTNPGRAELPIKVLSNVLTTTSTQVISFTDLTNITVVNPSNATVVGNTIKFTGTISRLELSNGEVFNLMEGKGTHIYSQSMVGTLSGNITGIWKFDAKARPAALLDGFDSWTNGTDTIQVPIGVTCVESGYTYVATHNGSKDSHNGANNPMVVEPSPEVYLANSKLDNPFMFESDIMDIGFLVKDAGYSGVMFSRTTTGCNLEITTVGTDSYFPSIHIQSPTPKGQVYTMEFDYELSGSNIILNKYTGTWPPVFVANLTIGTGHIKFDVLPTKYLSESYGMYFGNLNLYNLKITNFKSTLLGYDGAKPFTIDKLTRDSSPKGIVQINDFTKQPLKTQLRINK